MYAIGGTGTTIAAVALGLEKYDPSAVTGCVITLGQVGSMAHSLLSMSVGQVRRVRGMEPRRADVIGGGCLLMYHIMKKFGIPSITASDRDNLEGYVLSKSGGENL